MNAMGHTFPSGEIPAHLATYYGIQGTIERIEEGRASAYRVTGATESWLLKIFQPEFSRERIEKSAAFVDYLAANAFPCRAYVGAVNGDQVTMFTERCAVVIPWIEGEAPPANTLDTAQELSLLGAVCGHAHKLARGFPGTWTPHPPLSCDAALERFGRLAGQIRQGSEITGEIEARCRIIQDIGPELAESRAAMTQGTIHGDLYCAHIVLQKGALAGVVDILGGCYYPGWELMRCFFQSIPVLTAQTMPALAELWRSFVSGYRAHIDIAPEEIARAYDVYLLQLTGSTYGLTGPKGDETLRAFGRWRTATSAFLAEHREQLRAMMSAA
jgi:Ser/Thr protein kinase RdoA (MazF antagonist)